ncbi:matrixin family metalloprotease [Lactobacillus helsingborgensis]|uniref:matrixin family metalloprotease n=1 Tax=Lactobacillus helsingborgensis TaxID=1218494 RepID=UPI0027428407|nr:matrixin family metalloprotease [Lactobacillus helsingborgensis]WLT00812.1 matrixin family metalloprotease [Lactobacillus helsingborgensis]
MMKSSSKLLKSTVTLLSLITLAGTITPIVATPTTIQAKKAKKKHYITAKNKHQFKFGYAYTYNKKKHCYIGHKMSKKERQKFNMPKEQKIQKATSNYDVPKISNFTDKVLNKYNLLDQRWAKTTLTYNDNKLSNKQQNIVEDAINQINNLNIVKLIKTNKDNANLTFALKDKNNGRDLLGNADTEDTGQTYHGLFVSNTSKITFFTDELNKPTVTNYALTLNKLTIHEVGHALGLDHNLKDKSAIMYHIIDTDNIQTLDSTHVAIDQDYINRLALLYKN